jgi:hypothetical protein
MSLRGEEESIMMILPKDGDPVGNNDGVWKSLSSISFSFSLSLPLPLPLTLYLVDDMTF